MFKNECRVILFLIVVSGIHFSVRVKFISVLKRSKCDSKNFTPVGVSIACPRVDGLFDFGAAYEAPWSELVRLQRAEPGDALCLAAKWKPTRSAERLRRQAAS